MKLFKKTIYFFSHQKFSHRYALNEQISNLIEKSIPKTKKESISFEKGRLLGINNFESYKNQKKKLPIQSPYFEPKPLIEDTPKINTKIDIDIYYDPLSPEDIYNKQKSEFINQLKNKNLLDFPDNFFLKFKNNILLPQIQIYINEIQIKPQLKINLLNDFIKIFIKYNLNYYSKFTSYSNNIRKFHLENLFFPPQYFFFINNENKNIIFFLNNKEDTILFNNLLKNYYEYLCSQPNFLNNNQYFFLQFLKCFGLEPAIEMNFFYIPLLLPNSINFFFFLYYFITQFCLYQNIIPPKWFILLGFYVFKTKS